ncbi:hypothetical protein [Nocardia sp. NBC_01327]|uniref:hypothetical protein n=1 Tax=Nocardia sp. NBC_01327 TaxID=2903593 RepID=UPI002E14A1C6|nr:hypothetical protein OG326_23615 [Nocardia sp. NBC_01327]
MSKTGNIHTREAVILTHTTARIAGPQTGRIDVVHARTSEAAVTVVWGGIALRFLTAAAAATVLEGFAAARALLMNVDNTAPAQTPPAGEFPVATLALTWTWPTDYAVVHRSAYNQTWKRTVHWVDLHMGPVTFQILDHTGYHAAVELLRDAHRTAVVVCSDGGRWRADPTRPDYQRPLETPKGKK